MTTEHPNEFYRIDNGKRFFAVVVARDDNLIDVATNRSGTWQLDRLSSCKHMDWIVDKVTENNVPRCWEKLVNQPRDKNSTPPSASQAKL